MRYVLIVISGSDTQVKREKNNKRKTKKLFALMSGDERILHEMKWILFFLSFFSLSFWSVCVFPMVSIGQKSLCLRDACLKCLLHYLKNIFFHRSFRVSRMRTKGRIINRQFIEIVPWTHRSSQCVRFQQNEAKFFFRFSTSKWVFVLAKSLVVYFSLKGLLRQ